MTREEAEHRIAEKLKEIKQIAEEYGITDKYLTLTIINRYISFNNGYWRSDCNKILNYSEDINTGYHQHLEKEVEK